MQTEIADVTAAPSSAEGLSAPDRAACGDGLGTITGRLNLPSPLREIVLGAAATLLLYVVALAQFSSPAFPTSARFHSHLPYLMDKPVGEDGFYMLTVADYLATTGHILYNRGLPATGIQPLATVAFSVLDLVVNVFGGDALDLVRWILISGALLLLLFARQMASISASLAPESLRATVYFLAFFLVLSDFTLFRLFTYGLETGIYLCVLATVLRIVGKIVRAGTATVLDAVYLGLSAGFAGEARIDFGLVFAVVLTTLLFKRILTVRTAVIAGAIALLLVSPWFLFVHSVTGSWMPSSGKAESTLITGATALYRLRTMLSVVAGHLAPWSYGGMSPGNTWFAFVSVLGIALLLLCSTGRRARAAAPLAFDLVTLWCPALLGLVCAYVAFFNSTHFYYRYSAPIIVVLIPIVSILLAHTAWIRMHLVLTSAVLASTFFVWTFGALHTGRLANSQAVAAGYIHTNFPTARVGSFQSGVVGYFNRNVENLDGKLNLAAWKASKENRLAEFLDKEQINVLVDWPSIIAYNLPKPYLEGYWTHCPVPLNGTESICLIRKADLTPGK